MVAALAPVALGDIYQDSSVDGSYLDLLINQYGNLNGSGVNIGVVEAAALPNVSYGAGFVTPVPASNNPNITYTIAPQLVNGNPDLPGNSFNFVQLGGGTLGNNNNPLPAGIKVGNHPSAVVGTIMASGNTDGSDVGIAPSATITFASLGPSTSVFTRNNIINSVATASQNTAINMSWGSNLGNGTTTYTSANYLPKYGFTQATMGGMPLYLNAAMNAATTSLANAAMYTAGSFNGQAIPIAVMNTNTGLPVPVANNNGASTLSMYTDWQASSTNDLIVIAGNEGANAATLSATQGYFAPTAFGSAPNLANENGAPSDAYNCINVGATGQRGEFNNAGQFVANGAQDLNYGVDATYNTPNITGGSAIALGTGSTTGISPITGYGRIKTDIVAPGGDPGTPGTGNEGTAAAPGAATFDDQYTSTAGGVTTNAPASGFMSSDAYANAGITTQSNYYTRTGAVIQPVGEDGTSFAAPLVTGAAALLYQYGNTNFAGNTAAVDHRVMKAIILNGATHTYQGNNLMEPNGTTPWTRLAGKGTTPVLAGTTVAQYPGGINPSVRPGLDPYLGTGMLNVVNSLDNYAAGQQRPGLVNPVGWDMETVGTGVTPNSIVDAYTINVPVSGQFEATLCWDDFVTSSTGTQTFNNTSTFTRNNLTDLDLYLFHCNANGTVLGNDFDYSTSDIDNVEYLYDTLPAGTYQLDVVDAQYQPAQPTPFGLAWDVPEPSSIALIAAGSLFFARRRRSSDKAVSNC